MARALRDELQPSLLDRLVDDEPDKTNESRAKRVLSLEQLRQAVKRDIGWLLNTDNLPSSVDLGPHPEVARSVLNYGLPELAGSTISGIDGRELERRLRQTLLDFEPRILPGSLKVRVSVDLENASHNEVAFEIEGELWADPMPIRLVLQTEVDLETGNFHVTDELG